MTALFNPPRTVEGAAAGRHAPSMPERPLAQHDGGAGRCESTPPSALRAATPPCRGRSMLPSFQLDRREAAPQEPGRFEDTDLYGGDCKELPAHSTFDGTPGTSRAILGWLRHSRWVVEDHWPVRGADHNLRVEAQFID